MRKIEILGAVLERERDLFNLVQVLLQLAGDVDVPVLRQVPGNGPRSTVIQPGVGALNSRSRYTHVLSGQRQYRSGCSSWWKRVLLVSSPEPSGRFVGAWRLTVARMVNIRGSCFTTTGAAAVGAGAAGSTAIAGASGGSVVPAPPWLRVRVDRMAGGSVAGGEVGLAAGAFAAAAARLAGAMVAGRF